VLRRGQQRESKEWRRRRQHTRKSRRALALELEDIKKKFSRVSTLVHLVDEEEEALMEVEEGASQQGQEAMALEDMKTDFSRVSTSTFTVGQSLYRVLLGRRQQACQSLAVYYTSLVQT
jgi:hypothetical protein